MHFVFTVCDKAAAETCPFWPGEPVTGDSAVADPAAVAGSDGQDKRKAFREALLSPALRIVELLRACRSDKLGRLALETRLRQIGREQAPAEPKARG